MLRPLRRILLAALLLPVAATAENVFIENGDVVLVRHANAPGVGDPRGMKIDDCSTQRNLDEQGRAEARKLGDEFLARHVRVGAVLASQWCRTRETARIAFGADKVRDEPAFNSIFGADGPAREAQTRHALQIMQAWAGPGVLVVVTHQVNIYAIAHVPAATVEMVVMRKAAGGEMRVVGTIQP